MRRSPRSAWAPGMEVEFGLFEQNHPMHTAGVTLHQHWQYLGYAKSHILEVIDLPFAFLIPYPYLQQW